jgi:hypothetical protein
MCYPVIVCPDVEDIVTRLGLGFSYQEAANAAFAQELFGLFTREVAVEPTLCCRIRTM